MYVSPCDATFVMCLLVFFSDTPVSWWPAGASCRFPWMPLGSCCSEDVKRTYTDLGQADPGSRIGVGGTM
eukprot:1491043-Pyramimonas_sp.AAC.1